MFIIAVFRTKTLLSISDINIVQIIFKPYISSK